MISSLPSLSRPYPHPPHLRPLSRRLPSRRPLIICMRSLKMSSSLAFGRKRRNNLTVSWAHVSCRTVDLVLMATSPRDDFEPLLVHLRALISKPRLHPPPALLWRNPHARTKGRNAANANANLARPMRPPLAEVARRN